MKKEYDGSSICKYLEQNYKVESDNAKKLTALQETYDVLGINAAIDTESRHLAENVMKILEPILIALIKDIIGAEGFDILEILKKENKNE